MIIQVKNITQKYKNTKKLVINNLSFNVKKGELLGIIGADGMGKSTLLQLLCTLQFPNSGHISIFNKETKSNYKYIRKKIGYMPTVFSQYQDLSVEENLIFFATIYGESFDENYYLIRPIYRHLAPYKNRKARDLSGGMKQKLALCCTLIHKPSILFLDEPTVGIDALSRKDFWDILLHLKQQHVTIVLATSYMNETDNCDRVALMHNGNFLTFDKPINITQQFPHPLYRVKSKKMNLLMEWLKKSNDVINCYTFGEYHHFTVANSIKIYQVESFLNQRLKSPFLLEKAIPNVEDCFIDLTKNIETI